MYRWFPVVVVVSWLSVAPTFAQPVPSEKIGRQLSSILVGQGFQIDRQDIEIGRFGTNDWVMYAQQDFSHVCERFKDFYRKATNLQGFTVRGWITYARITRVDVTVMTPEGAIRVLQLTPKGGGTRMALEGRRYVHGPSLRKVWRYHYGENIEVMYHLIQ